MKSMKSLQVLSISKVTRVVFKSPSRNNLLVLHWSIEQQNRDRALPLFLTASAFDVPCSCWPTRPARICVPEWKKENIRPKAETEVERRRARTTESVGVRKCPLFKNPFCTARLMEAAGILFVVTKGRLLCSASPPYDCEFYGVLKGG